MAKYVKCIENYNLTRYLTIGDCYKILGETSLMYQIQDDKGHEDWYDMRCFEEPYDLPEPITFSSQQEFEDAVMAVIIKRLNVCDYNKEGKIFLDVVDAFQDDE